MGREGITMGAKARGTGRPKEGFAVGHSDAIQDEGDLTAAQRAMLEIKRSILKKLIMRMNEEHLMCS
jgi:hypothetical protein